MSDRKPRLKELALEFRDLTWSEVTSVAIQLDVTFSKLRQIEDDNRDYNTRLYGAMDTWLENDPDATWAKVIEALKAIDKNVLARKLEKKFCQASSTSENVPEILPSLPTVPGPSSIVGTDQCPSASPSLPPTSDPSISPAKTHEPSSSSHSQSLKRKRRTPSPPHCNPSLFPPSHIPQPNPLTATKPDELPGYQPLAVKVSKQERIKRVKKEALELETQFATLVGQAEFCLSQQESKSRTFLPRFCFMLKNLTISKKFEHMKFLDDIRDSIEKASKISDIFYLLRRHWNYTDFGLLHHIIGLYGDSEAKIAMEAYLHNLEMFEKQTAVKDYEDATGHKKEVPEFYAEVDVEVCNSKDPLDYTLYDARICTKSLAERAALEQYVPLLKKARIGSMIITVALPRCALELLQQVLYTEFLSTLNIVSIKVHDWLGRRQVKASCKECLKDSLALVTACKAGKTENVTSLIDSGVDLDFSNIYNETALRVAIEGGHYDTVEVLLEGGIDPNKYFWDGKNALHKASVAGNTKIISLLLSHGADIHEIDKGDDETALHFASEGGHYDAVKLLLERGADPSTLTMFHGRNALHKASIAGHAEIVTLLLDNGADVHAVDEKDEKSALSLALGWNNVHVMRALIEREADPNTQNEENRTALHYICDGDDFETVKLLLEKGANPNIPDEDGSTAFHQASGAGHTAIVRLLLDHGADIKATDVDGKTALRKACGAGHVAVVSLLLDRGADIHAVDWGFGSTSLHQASGAGYTDVVSLLLDRGANIHAVDKGDGKSALILAAEKGHVDVMKVLIQRGADLNTQDQDGHTAVMHTTMGWWRRSRLEAIHLLTDAKADVNIPNKDGLTCLMMAAKRGKAEKGDEVGVLDILVKAGAHLNEQENSTGWTALMFAAKEGHVNALNKLVSAGADVSIVDKNGVTARDVARVQGNKDAAKALDVAEQQLTTKLSMQSSGDTRTEIVELPRETATGQLTAKDKQTTSEPTTISKALKNMVNKSTRGITAAYIRLERRLKSSAEKEASLEKKRRIQEEECVSLPYIEIAPI